MVATAGMVVTGVAIMGGAVGGLGRMGLGRLVGSEHQHQYPDAAIRIMDMGTIHTTAMATTAHITATIAPTTIVATTRTIAHTVTTAVGTVRDITGSAVV